MAYNQPQELQPILDEYYGVPGLFLVPSHSTAITQPALVKVYPIRDTLDHKKVLIRKLKVEMVYDDLQNYFSQFGEIECIDLRRSLCSRGFAFITFKTIESANNVLAYRHHILKHKVVGIKRSTSISFTMKLIVKGLDRTITSHDIRTYFERYAPVSNVLMRTDKQNQPRDFCFVILFIKVEPSSVIIYRHHVINGKQVTVRKVEKNINQYKLI